MILTDIFLRARMKLLGNKNLYPLYHKIYGDRSGHFCSKKTDLCVEGFQSSANTFVFNVLYLLRSDLRYARHKHVVANLKLAYDYCIPTVILFRDPVDCIPSLASRFRPGILESLYRYIYFYRYVVENMSSRVLLVSFEEVTGEIKNTVRRISDFAGFSFDENGMKNIERKAKHRIRKRTQKRAGTTDRISLPNQERENRKSDLREKLRQHSKLEDAKELYNNIQNLHRDQRSKFVY